MTYVPIVGAENVEAGSLFSVGEVSDKSGFKFPEGEEEKIVLTEAMTGALKKALEAKGAQGEGQWLINVDITEYAPGNAFARWLMPGAGATVLGVVAHIVNQEGVAAARIPIRRSIGFGGGYTIGAWEYVFDEVAEAIVETLINPEKRTPSKN
ncbi:MAG: DUF4410 domain-containing protein [Deltaproteobacteria bacterium]|nr:DUF4410 domain-containing protein [Deltaproteobacteria bacterium]